MIRACFLILVLATAAGCESDCEYVCETGKDCGFVDERFVNVGCSDACGVLEDYSAGCEAQFDAYYGCLADSINGCTSTSACTPEIEAYNRCIGD